jgi:hypothetical protein
MLKYLQTKPSHYIEYSQIDINIMYDKKCNNNIIFNINVISTIINHHDTIPYTTISMSIIFLIIFYFSFRSKKANKFKNKYLNNSTIDTRTNMSLIITLCMWISMMYSCVVGMMCDEINAVNKCSTILNYEMKEFIKEKNNLHTINYICTGLLLWCMSMCNFIVEYIVPTYHIYVLKFSFFILNLCFCTVELCIELTPCETNNYFNMILLICAFRLYIRAMKLISCGLNAIKNNYMYNINILSEQHYV